MFYLKDGKHRVRTQALLQLLLESLRVSLPGWVCTRIVPLPSLLRDPK
jgi:hypothetical protein